MVTITPYICIPVHSYECSFMRSHLHKHTYVHTQLPVHTAATTTTTPTYTLTHIFELSHIPTPSLSHLLAHTHTPLTHKMLPQVR